MRDFFDSIAILITITVGMIVCAVAVPIGLLVAVVWAPAEGVCNFCRNVCRLREWK